jgi:VWFA-related protein
MGIDAVKRYLRTIPIVALCLLPWWAAAPQQAPPGSPQVQPALEKFPLDLDQTTFRAQSDEVEVPVTVASVKGLFVSDLTKEDFRILDEGKPQQITYFNHDISQPVVVGFLIDLSSNSRTQWENYKEAAKELIYGLIPDDPKGKKFAGYLITYANEAELAVNTSTDSSKLAARLDKVKPSGGSALYDAIYMACTSRTLVPGEPYDPRRIIVIVGDGHNNSSGKSLDEVLELAKRRWVTIFGMSTVAYGSDNESQAVLERLASETGGRVEYPLGNELYKDINGTFSKPMDAGNYVYEAGTGGYAGEVARAVITAVSNIVGNITTQYILRFKPDPDPPGAQKLYHKIKVDIPSLDNVKVYAKEGYFPNPLPAAPAPAGAPNVP